jgi:phosphoenolpyruvate carboxykinase (ATP)
MPIKATRRSSTLQQAGGLNEAEFREGPYFGFEVPVAVTRRRTKLTRSRGAQADADECDQDRTGTGAKFIDNFEQFADHVDESVRQAAPVTA